MNLNIIILNIIMATSFKGLKDS